MTTPMVTARVPEDTKTCAGHALQQAGKSPSQAINLLWDFLAACENSPEAVQEAFAYLDSRANAEQAARDQMAADLSGAIITRSHFADALGIDPSALPLANVRLGSDDDELERGREDDMAARYLNLA